METIDILYGQNWIDQYQTNIENYPLSLPGGGRMHNTQDVWAFIKAQRYRLDMSHYILCAFCWVNTPQHPTHYIFGVWSKRRHHDYDSFPLSR